MKKNILLISLISLLTVSLIACAAPTPAPAPAPTTAPTTAPTAAPTTAPTTAPAPAPAPAPAAPAQVQYWEPAVWEGSGPHWDQLNFIADYINAMSGGRIVVTPSVPGAIVGTDEQLDAVAMGTTEAMFTYPGYHGGKIPLLNLHATLGYAPTTVAEAYHLIFNFEGGAILEILRQAYADYGDVHLVGTSFEAPGILLMSNTPIYGVDDLKGLKFRGSEVSLLAAMEKLGASTVFIPGTELYTALATGTIDAAQWGPAPSDVAMGFHEIAKYWVKKPFMIAEPTPVDFIVNGEVWRSLDDDLKAIVAAAVDASQIFWTANLGFESPKAWNFVKSQGVEVIEWSDEDSSALSAARLGNLPNLLVDAYSNDYAAVTKRFIEEIGR